MSPKDILLCPYLSVFLSNHQRSFLVQQMGTNITGQYSVYERFWKTQPNWPCLNQTLPLRELRVIYLYRRGDEKW